MFGLFKRDPARNLQARYEHKLREARDAQRNGKIALFAALSAEAEEIAAEIDRLLAAKT